MPARRLILASGSPQRRAILAALGVAFELRPAPLEEIVDGEPAAMAAENARRKALAVAAELAGDEAGEVAVIGVDTVVALDGRPLGKPVDEPEARSFLQALSGRTHEVFSGVCVWRAGGATPVAVGASAGQGAARAGGCVECALARTLVTFRALPAREIEWSLRRGEWVGRAGGYAIQEGGGALIERIEGDYLNVVGLPLATLLALLPDLLVRA